MTDRRSLRKCRRAPGRFRAIFLGFAIAAVLAASTALPTVAQGPAADIQTMLEARDNQIKGMLNSESLDDATREQLKDVVNGVIDFSAMGRQALGPHWEPLTAEQQSHFTEVFSDIVRSQSVADLDIYKSTVEYDAITVDGDKATVETTTSLKNKSAKVVYLMHVEDDEWRVYDFVIDDVSTAEGYARSFQSIVRKKGFATLMEKLEARRAKES